MHKYYQLFVLLSFITLLGCNDTVDNPLDKPVVEVGDKSLTRKELYDLIPDNIPKDPEEKDVTKLLEEYRRSLLVHQYQQKMLLQKYSPLITSSEIKEYYNKMIDNFILNENIVKSIFIIVPRTAPNLRDLRKWYRSDAPEHLVEMESYCYQNAKKYDISLEKWKPFSEINLMLPRQISRPDRFLRYNHYYETSDSLNYYYINIKDFSLAGETAPIEYVEDRIKAILLNKKRLDFINKLESDLYDEGLKQKIIKFY